MPKVRLTEVQRKVFKCLEERSQGIIDLDEVVDLLFAGHRRPVANARTRANSVVKCIANKFDCQCCFIDRISPIGRSYKAQYRFRINCSKGS